VGDGGIDQALLFENPLSGKGAGYDLDSEVSAAAFNLRLSTWDCFLDALFDLFLDAHVYLLSW